MLLISVFFITVVKAELLTNKILKIAGSSSKYGPYLGEIELRNVNNQLTAIKVFTYTNYKFENLNVQEVWTGQAYQSQNQLTITYNIRQADFLLSAEGMTRTREMFNNKLVVTENYDLNSKVANYKRASEVFSEQILSIGELATVPLWQNLRNKVESYGYEASSIVNLAKSFLIIKVFNWFHAEEKVKAYENREEYKSHKQYFVYDPTDYDFYQKNPTLLRVVNKIPDTISLVEDIQRRNAYAPSLASKAQHFDNDMTAYHMNTLGIFSITKVDQSNKVNGYIIDNDASLWTGMYLASQAMRYQVTGESEALENVKKSLKGLMLLMDITDDPTDFARSAMADDGSIQPNEKYRRGKNQHSDKIWLYGGNNDMFKGLIHGFIWSYMVIPDSEVELRKQLLKHMEMVPNLTVAKTKVNKAAAVGLRALATNSSSDKNNFVKYSLIESAPASLLGVDGSIYVGGVADWSGINLSMVGTITDILIAKAISKDMPSKIKWFFKNEDDVLKNKTKNLYSQWQSLADAKRDFLTIATYAFSIKEGLMLSRDPKMLEGVSSDSEERKYFKNLSKAIWSLREIPINRSHYDTSYDYSYMPEWSLSWWPRLPWKSFSERQPVEFHMDGAYSYPLFEGPGIGNNFIWKADPFAYQDVSYKFAKVPGADYLYTYWMSRFAKLL